VFSPAQAHKVFILERSIANLQLDGRFERTITAFMDLAEAAKHYPCVKKAWLEFLGELPESGSTVTAISRQALDKCRAKV
jgi:hypothetical protein